MFDGIFINGLNGLQVQEQRLAALSDNIANSTTIGYKRTEVHFASLINDSFGKGPLQTSSVKSQPFQNPGVQGEVFGTEINTNVALQGKGFFVVNTKSDGTGDTLFSRDGTFDPDSTGAFVNKAGHYLMGFSTAVAPFTQSVAVAAATNTASTASSLIPISISRSATLQGAAATTTASATGNIPPVASQTVGNTFQSTMGVFDSNQNAHSVTVTYTVTASGYVLSATSPDGTVTSSSGSTPITVGSSTPVTLNATWTTPQTGTSTIALDISGLSSGTAQFNARATATNGNVAGILDSFQITSEGLINAKLTNNNIVTVGQIAVATFTSDEHLETFSGTAFKRTNESGAPRITAALGSSSGSAETVGQSLERSNVDLANELTELIIVQRSYSFNSTVLQTADQMTRTATELKR